MVKEYETLDDAVNNLTGKLKDRIKNEEINKSELLSLMGYYTERFNSDNTAIWTTSSIFMSVALASFGAFAAIANPEMWHILILGFPASVLAIVWFIIVANLRAFQDRTMIHIMAIEKVMGVGLGDTGGEIVEKVVTRDVPWCVRCFVRPKAVIRKLRVLAFCVPVLWGVVFFCKLAGLAWSLYTTCCSCCCY